MLSNNLSIRRNQLFKADNIEIEYELYSTSLPRSHVQVRLDGPKSMIYIYEKTIHKPSMKISINENYGKKLIKRLGLEEVE